MIGGGAGIAGHITIADGVQIQGRARIIGSIDKPGSYTSGTGMMETQLWRKNAVRFSQLDELYRRVVELEKQLKSSNQQSLLNKKAEGEDHDGSH